MVIITEDTLFITKAYYYAKGLHQHQKRKYTGEPYFNHCKSVANLLHKYETNINAIQAAFLHDTIEDCRVTYNDILMEFGEATANLVREVTDVSKPEDGNRAVRKKLDLDHLAKSSYLGASIKLADTIDNTISIIKHNLKFAQTYIPEKFALLEVLSHGNEILYNLADKTVRDADIILRNSSQKVDS